MCKKLAFPVFVVIGAAAILGCSGANMPTSPSIVKPLTRASGAGGRFRALDDPALPTPLSVVINIVGSFGSNAFMPNPTLANMGDQIVFTNTDVTLHHIVLDDGTDLGDVPPGESSVPIALLTPTTTYHCTIHPTMVGSINGDLPAAPTDPYPYMPPPADDYYGGYY